MNQILNLGLIGVSFAFVLLSTYTVAKVVYNILSHPLRKYPGSIFAASTSIPLLYARVTGNIVKWTHAQHQRYGEVVRVSPNELSFIDPGAWKDIYGHRTAGKPNFQKDMKLYGPDLFAGEEGAAGIVRADDSAHGRQRRLVSHAFSDKALKEQEPLFKQYVDLLVQKVSAIAEKDPTAKINLVDWYNFTTFDIMADLTFGEPLHLLDKSKYLPWVSAIFGSIKVGTYEQVFGTMPFVKSILNKMIPKSVLEKRKLHMSHTIDRVNKRLAVKTDRPDIWTYVLRHSDSDSAAQKGLSGLEMYSNAATFMVAGTETTATQLGGVTYQLLKKPEAMARLVAEVREAFPTKEDITMVALARLEFLNACLEEGLRIYPPVPLGLPRITPTQGAVVCGKEVPGGAVVSLPQYAAYHSPSNFKNPDDFIPQRWLPEAEKEFAGDNKNTLQPFSFGPRNCVGKNLAYHEMRLVLATVLWNFDLTFCEESDNWPDQQCYSLWEKHPLLVKLTPIRRT
ncbi:cytochrome P450 [Cenococcum geophilum 1.58]|uniref:Cytochrome P450 n=1 Tax=Cenococcum geophilum 1.58 TaxID=794803 RepID=A0ACC8EPA5_9PEZI|nr:cytochrome P450 [Cenococcum geophilum 1.58]